MSDFSQLCPLFNTGVYSELTIPGPIYMSGVSATSNALVGALTRAANPGSFKFQRTVIVTKVYVKKDKTCGTACIIEAKRHAGTGTAAGTTFASFAVTTTSTKNTVSRIRAMTTAAKTFLAADVLGFAPATKKITDGGRYSFIIRYKEK
jgi:hypothetical protein